MASQINTGGMDSFVDTLRNPFKTVLASIGTFVQQHEDVFTKISCGCMIPSSFFLPMLFKNQKNSGSKAMLFPTTFIFVVSVLSFTYVKRVKIARNLLQTAIPWAAIPGFYMVLPSQQSTSDFVLMLPAWVAVGLLLSVSFTPAAREIFLKVSRFLSSLNTETSGHELVRSNSATVDPGSVISDENLHLGPIFGYSLDGINNIPHMGAHFDDSPYHAGRSPILDPELGLGSSDSFSISSRGSSSRLVEYVS